MSAYACENESGVRYAKGKLWLTKRARVQLVKLRQAGRHFDPSIRLYAAAGRATRKLRLFRLSPASSTTMLVGEGSSSRPREQALRADLSASAMHLSPSGGRVPFRLHPSPSNLALTIVPPRT